MVTVTIYHRRMKITKLETLRLEEFPNLLWLRVHSDAGVIGLGETHRAAPSVEAYVHEYIAPRVLGKDPLRSSGSRAASPTISAGADRASRRVPSRRSTS